MNMLKEVKFICSNCDKEWVEKQDTEDEFFGVATTQTLCAECAEGYLERVKGTYGKQRCQQNDMS